VNSVREFLVRIDIDTGGLGEAEVSRLRHAEAVRARALSEAGTIQALWRVPGKWANYGVWRSVDRDSLQGELSTLPLFSYMRFDIQELESHPSDPRGSQGSARGRVFTLPPLPVLSIRRRQNGSTRLIGPAPADGALPELPALDMRRRGASFRDAASSAAPGTSPATDAIIATIEADFTEVLGESLRSDADVLAFTAVRAAVAQTDAGRAGVVRLTHSGGAGLRSAAITSGDGICVDVGMIRREARVRSSGEGGEALQVRTVAVLTVMDHGSSNLESVEQLLNRIQRHVEAGPLGPSVNSSPN